MKNNTTAKIYKVTVVAILVFILTVPAHLVMAAAREGVIRPGFMAGDGGSGTDYFIDMLFPVSESKSGVVFFNPNFRLGDDDSNEQNIGIVARSKVGSDFILGTNFYYDSVETEEENDFKQFGLGLELLSKDFDIRGNYYRPFGDRYAVLDRGAEYGFGDSSILKYNGVEEALRGFDVEAGLLVPFVSNLMETRVYAGIYEYNVDFMSTDDVEGDKYRVELRPSDYLQINVESKHDDVRGTDTFAGLTLDIPFGGGKSFSIANIFKSDSETVRSIDERMTDRVVRDRHIITPEATMEIPEKFAELSLIKSP